MNKISVQTIILLAILGVLLFDVRETNNITYEYNYNYIDSLDMEIDSINKKIELKHEEIDTSNKPHLRDLFNDFRSRTK